MINERTKMKEANILLVISGTFLYKNNCNFNSYKFSHKLASVTSSSFWEVCDLATKIISVFCL